MSDSSILIKGLAFLAILSIFIGLLAEEYPGEVTAVSPWEDLQVSLSTAPEWPVFYDPFVAEVLSVVDIPFENGTDVSGGFTDQPDSVVGCAIADYWKCVATNDGNESYIVMNGLTVGLYNAFAVNVTSRNFGARTIEDVVLEVWCRNNGTVQAQGILMIAEGAVFSTTFETFCPISDNFEPVIAHEATNPSSGAQWNAGTWENPTISVGPYSDTPASSDLWFTFVRLIIYYRVETVCTGNWFENTGCQIGQFLNSFVKFFILIGSAIAYGILVIVTALTFVGGIIIGFFFGVYAIATFFLTIDAPPIVQAILGVMFFGIIAFILFLVVKLVRGTGISP